MPSLSTLLSTQTSELSSKHAVFNGAGQTNAPISTSPSPAKNSSPSPSSSPQSGIVGCYLTIATKNPHSFSPIAMSQKHLEKLMHRKSPTHRRRWNRSPERICDRLLACAIILVSVQSLHAEWTFRTAAVTGNAAPGTDGGTLDFFQLPILDAMGHVTFAASVQGAGVTTSNDTGIWSETSGVLSLVAREGNQAPGVALGVNFGSFSSIKMGSEGSIAFAASLVGSGLVVVNDTGIWSASAGQLQLVAREGSQAPGVARRALFADLQGAGDSRPMVDASGRVAFFAGAFPVTGVWLGHPGSLTPVMLSGNQAPSLPAGAKFDFGFPFADGNMAINSAGKVAFRAIVSGGGIAGDPSIWTTASGTVSLVALTGDSAPGTPSGANFGSYWNPIFGTPVINDAGFVAFAGSLQTDSGGVTMFNDSGIWSQGSGALTLIAREGSHAPGTPEGVVFGQFAGAAQTENRPAIDSFGRVAFRADLRALAGLDANNNSGIWSEASGTLSLVAREGDQAPGASPGERFFAFNQDPVINSKGHIAIWAALQKDGVFTGYGLWVQGDSNGLKLVVRSGDLFQIAPGTFRTVSSVSFGKGPSFGSAGDYNGGYMAFNDAQTLALYLDFSDGTSGIFTASQSAGFQSFNLSNANTTFSSNLQNTGSIVGPGTISVATGATLISDAVTVDTWSVMGSHIIRENVSSMTTSRASALTLSVTSILDLTNSNFILQSSASDKSTKLSFLSSALASGFHNGDWLGTGITSSTVAQDQSAPGSHTTTLALYDNALLNLPTIGGIPADSNSLFITTALIGDTNFDNQVNQDDFNVVAQNWQTMQNTWNTGDLNYDGFVDLLDAVLIASHFQSPTETTTFIQGDVVPVPEPAAAAILLPLTLFLRTRPRRS